MQTPELKLKLFILTFFVFVLITGCEHGDNNDKKGIEKLISEIELEEIDSPGITVKIDYLHNLSSELDYPSGIAKSYSLRGRYYFSKSDYESALKYFTLAVNQNKPGGNTKQLGEDYENIGRTYNRLRNVDSAITSFNKSTEIRKLINDSTGLGSSLNNIGVVYWSLSQFDSAIIYFEKALELRSKLSNKEHLASTTNNIGTVYYQWAIYDKALEYYLQALELNREINNYANVPVILTNIGIIFKETSQEEKAIEYFQESLGYAIASNDTQNIGYVYNSIAGTFIDKNRDSSIYYYNKSLEAYKAVGSAGGIIICLKGLAENYIRSNDLGKARNYFNQILEIATREKNRLRIAEAYKYLGNINKSENQLTLAKEYFEKCIQISLEMNTKSFLRDSYKNLSEIYEATGDVNKALISIKEYLNYKEQIDNEDSQRRINDLKSRFEFEKYQRALDVQKYDNQQQRVFLFSIVAILFGAIIAAGILFVINNKRKKVNEILLQKNEQIEGQAKELVMKNHELTELNHAKEKLFSIIAHDLKNPFFALLNYSLILKEDYHQLTDEERLGFISNIRETSIQTYELLENLLNLSASRTGKIDFNPVNIKLKELFDKISNLYQNQILEKEIRITNFVDEKQMVFADPKMLEVVFRNLLNNAIKYTNPSGTIEMKTETLDGSVLTIIKDNGVGMDETTRDNIFNINSVTSTPGTKGERGTGLGLGLCKEFVEKNNGSIYVESEPNKGSTFYITLPKS
ncbi:MAG: tetratricopeptide repeat-containing sensor histidine kinase [Ignavibacteria bacterium]|nr:tetratricopeptide repeat-containing sensor histidine kinase [Ignavibacteria bacterium]